MADVKNFHDALAEQADLSERAAAAVRARHAAAPFANRAAIAVAYREERARLELASASAKVAVLLATLPADDGDVCPMWIN